MNCFFAVYGYMYSANRAIFFLILFLSIISCYIQKGRSEALVKMGFLISVFQFLTILLQKMLLAFTYFYHIFPHSWRQINIFLNFNITFCHSHNSFSARTSVNEKNERKYINRCHCVLYKIRLHYSQGWCKGLVPLSL